MDNPKEWVLGEGDPGGGQKPWVGVEIPGRVRWGEGEKLGIGNSGAGGEARRSRCAWQRRGGVRSRSAARSQPQDPARRVSLPPLAQRPLLGS